MYAVYCIFITYIYIYILYFIPYTAYTDTVWHTRAARDTFSRIRCIQEKGAEKERYTARIQIEPMVFVRLSVFAVPLRNSGPHRLTEAVASTPRCSCFRFHAASRGPTQMKKAYCTHVSPGGGSSCRSAIAAVVVVAAAAAVVVVVVVVVAVVVVTVVALEHIHVIHVCRHNEA